MSSARKYCPNCQRNVEGQKKRFSVLAFIFTGFVPYLIYHCAVKKYKCPICDMAGLEPPKSDVELRQIRNGG